MLDISTVFDGTITPGSAVGQTSAVVGAAITTTRVSTNIIDLLTGRDLGPNQADEELHVDATAAFVGGTSVQISLQVCATTNGTYLPLIFSPVIPVAQLIAGAPIFRYRVPLNQLLNGTAGILNAPGRYLQLNYVVVGTFSAGAVFSYLNADRNAYYSYPNNYTVSTTTSEI